MGHLLVPPRLPKISRSTNHSVLRTGDNSTITEILRRHGPLDARVRRASTKGMIKFEARAIRMSQAFGGEPIGIRANPTSCL